MDICAEIRILFSQQPVRYRPVMSKYGNKLKNRLGQIIEEDTKMVGWKVGEGGPLGQWEVTAVDW